MARRNAGPAIRLHPNGRNECDKPDALGTLGVPKEGLAWLHRIDVRDLEGLDRPTDAQVEGILPDWRPDLLGMRARTMGRRPVHEIARVARRRYGVPVIVAGGPHASDNPGEILADDAFDAAAVGEGELTAVELVGRLLEDGGPGSKPGLEGIAGLAVRSNGGIEFTPRPLIEDLDSLPYADREILSKYNGYRKLRRRLVFQLCLVCRYIVSLICRGVNMQLLFVGLHNVG